jgi:hypothetical protein
MDLHAFLQRARTALSVPTLYWLGHGGWQTKEAQPPVPSRAIDLDKELEQMRRERPQVHRAYMAALAKSGLDRATLPRVACDCSGFVCWALGVPRDGSPLPGGWINTDAMDADAKGAQRLFVPAAKAVPGALLVHPKPPGADKGPGHVAIVVAVDANGRPTRMLHCAPDNYLLEPPAGLPRNAIAETDTHHFDNIATTRVVMWKAFVQ